MTPNTPADDTGGGALEKNLRDTEKAKDDARRKWDEAASHRKPEDKAGSTPNDPAAPKDAAE